MFILSSSRKDSDHVLVHCILPDVHKREGGPAEATDETTLKKNCLVFYRESDIKMPLLALCCACTLNRYDSFSDVGENRVYFASKILTPCRMH